MPTLVKPLLVLALLALLMALFIEAGSLLFLDAAGDGDRPAGAQALPVPGLGVPALALFDALVFWVVGLIALGTVVPPALLARVQGAATFVATLCAAVAAIVLIVMALALITIMLGLLLAIPFGTIIYLAIYGSFDQGAASAALSSAMVFKLAFAALLIASHRRFLENKSLLLLTITSLVLPSLVGLTHSIVPRVLVSITDAVAAIIIAIVTIVWAIPFFVGAVVSILRALKPEPLV